ncbi:hypothetical protein SteCoe_38185 [Stentor coeruleus]|uniref:Protein kinase domain-containing protein n=1 Tax=Stentor coeruleus TaxID=5963 RepID=A0A1R2ALR6_9CILI|nr:hypothetical protein SteCoe_38185 [Stentor coeruleus]
MESDWVSEDFDVDQENFSREIERFNSVRNVNQIESVIEIGVEIVISDGQICDDDSAIQPCILTTYQSHDLDSLRKLLYVQMLAYENIFKGQLIAVNFEKKSENYKISLVTKKYKATLKDYLEESEDKKLELLLMTAKVLHKLSKQNMFYGKIRLECIYITEDEQIALRYMYWIFYDENFEINFYKVFQELEYLSPELILLQKCPLDNVKEMYESLNVYSFGLLFLRFFNCEFPKIIFIRSDRAALNYILGIELKKLVSIVFSEHVMKLMNENSVFAIIEYCLMPVLEERWDFYKIISQIKLCMQKNQVIKANAPVLNIFDNRCETIMIICQMLSSCHSAILLKNNRIKVIKKFISKIKSNTSLLAKLQSAESNYFSTPCKAERILAEEGILTFLYFLFKDIDRDEILSKEFSSTLSMISPTPYYANVLINTINLKNENLKDLLISEMIIQTFSKDWKYLFPCKYEDYPSLKPLQKLNLNKLFFEEVKKFFNENLIVGILSQFCSNSQLAKIQILDGLNRAYITKLIPSLHGLTTYNLNIFIKDYRAEVRKNMNNAEKGATLITIFHELSHFLRRYDSQTLLELRSKFTPNKSGCLGETEVIGMTEWEIANLRGESGEKSELELFGEPLISINEDAGSFLLQGNFPSLEEFKARFFEENKKDSARVSMIRGSDTRVFLQGLRCGVSLKIHS